MLYQTNPDYFDDTERDELPEREPFQFIFDDGSMITLSDFAVDLNCPHRKTSRLWLAEEIEILIARNEWDMEQARKYIIKNYE